MSADMKMWEMGALGDIEELHAALEVGRDPSAVAERTHVSVGVYPPKFLRL
jgi:hypothetical protein